MIVSYNIPEELDQRIRDLAEEEGRSLSAMATRLLEKALGAKSKKSLARPKLQNVDFELASFILDGVGRIKPNIKTPNIKTWAEECRKMRELDGREPRRIAEVFHWANHDTFWQTNILSPAKLRKQFDQLELKANQVRSHENAPRNPASRTDRIREQTRRALLDAETEEAYCRTLGEDDTASRPALGGPGGRLIDSEGGVY